jgi:hypothetical protein
MTNHKALKTLETAERAAWRAKMNGSDVDTCTIFGQVGKLEQAWRDAADACGAYRAEHGLIGLSWRQIEARA